MDARLVLRRPVVDLFSGRSEALLVSAFTQQQCRHQSSYRRTAKRLMVKPDPSFAPSDPSAPDHIIFNPPSAAPSVLHTPLLFLPKDDKRRALLASVASAQAPKTSAELPPVWRERKYEYQRHHLSEADVEEMRRLRSSDPEKWTQLKLAKKFKCTAVFVGIATTPSKDKIAKDRAKWEAIKARWTPAKRMAREDRMKRMELACADA